MHLVRYRDYPERDSSLILCEVMRGGVVIETKSTREYLEAKLKDPMPKGPRGEKRPGDVIGGDV